MKLTNDKIYSSIQILSSLNEKGKLGYACARNLRRLMDAGKEYMEKRDELIQKYGEAVSGGEYRFTPEKANEFDTELNEYSEIEHEVDIYQIDEDTFCSGTLNNQQMFMLDWMVAE